MLTPDESLLSANLVGYARSNPPTCLSSVNTTQRQFWEPIGWSSQLCPESTKCPGHKKPINIATLLSQLYVAISLFSKRSGTKRRKKKQQENHVLCSPLSQASTLALTEQVAPEQARCRIRACVFSHTRRRIVKSFELDLPWPPYTILHCKQSAWLENLPWFEKNDLSSNSKFKSLR